MKFSVARKVVNNHPFMQVFVQIEKKNSALY